jgi:hypothetical protein
MPLTVPRERFVRSGDFVEEFLRIKGAGLSLCRFVWRRVGGGMDLSPLAHGDREPPNAETVA